MNTPHEFYGIRMDKYERFNELVKLIEEHVKTEEAQKPLEYPKIGDNCLVWFDGGYIRGRIIGALEEEKVWEVFGCDYGYKIDAIDSEIIPTTKEIVEFMSYCAVMISLTGVLPVEGEHFLNENTVNIFDVLEDYQVKNNLFAYVTDIKSSVDWLQPLNFYGAILVGRTADREYINLTQNLIEKKLIKFDPTKKSDILNFDPLFLKAEAVKSGIDEDDTSVDDDEDDWEDLIGASEKYKAPIPAPETENEDLDSDEFKKIVLKQYDDQTNSDELDEEDIFEVLDIMHLGHLIPGLKEQQSRLKEKIENDSSPLLAIEAPPAKEINHKQDSSFEKTQSNVPHEDQLVFCTKQPSVNWQQTDLLVLLSIHLGDNQEYHLEVYNKYIIFAHLVPTDNQLMVINLFGIINNKMVSHEIRGLNLIIRLPKNLPGIPWPRLTDEEEKFAHIKYNFDSLKPIDEDLRPRIIGHKRRVRHDSVSDDDSTTEEEDEDYDVLEAGDPLFDGIIK